MKKPITIGVIVVIATILVSSTIDFSAIGEKPTNEIYAQGRTTGNGEVVCPDGATKVPGGIVFGLQFVEEEIGNKGGFSTSTTVINPPGVQSALYNGGIDSGSYMFKGIGNPNENLGILCGIDPAVLHVFTVWGECGRDVLINFETDLGISGTSTGTVLCV
jgi:hypothetical protein